MMKLDIEQSNILVNHHQSNTNIRNKNDKQRNRFTDIHLAGFGSTVAKISLRTPPGDEIGIPIFRSPEAMPQMKWGPETDTWSFDATVQINPFSLTFLVEKGLIDMNHVGNV
ncbi:hypothetical protein BO83DRAFT_222726 [Aspergillus eucalypticola CBS 122712]|uniref:Protein kinase domain-containing protein n=1 Tax=Aspergillus eucalypticola (strain CBS 122712 / IBT 29274) TaxID=1448314 RepID=A0A317VVP9_ASPEC|nr:uncharacterized protein BO83DRAFT_222726 [Aspergillus eucalypticola CBS 122712]PWY77669.1 hypothetical protein BO83DRAFT_222726 [Aspergillus eucalypticola CBS 122712]